jgi:hypothetical protein
MILSRSPKHYALKTARAAGGVGGVGGTLA